MYGLVGHGKHSQDRQGAHPVRSELSLWEPQVHVAGIRTWTCPGHSNKLGAGCLEETQLSDSTHRNHQVPCMGDIRVRAGEAVRAEAERYRAGLRGQAAANQWERPGHGFSTAQAGIMLLAPKIHGGPQDYKGKLCSLP